MNMNHWTIFRDITTLAVALITALWGLRTYAMNARTRRAEFIYQLHEAFFVNATYKNVRSTLDSDEEWAHLKRQAYTDEEPEEFTDFLNFFELTAYLWKTKHLGLKDVEALLGYYLQLLETRRNIRNYIANPAKSFGDLDKLLQAANKHT